MEEEKKLNHLNEPIETESAVLLDSDEEAPEMTPELSEKPEEVSELPEKFEEEPDFGADRLELEDPQEVHESEPEEEEEQAPQEKPDYEREMLHPR